MYGDDYAGVIFARSEGHNHTKTGPDAVGQRRRNPVGESGL